MHNPLNTSHTKVLWNLGITAHSVADITVNNTDSIRCLSRFLIEHDSVLVTSTA